MEGKRLDLDAPLLSFRRITSPEVREKAAPPNSLRRKSFPYFSSDTKAGGVGNGGTVPFGWETAPGQPKDSSVKIGSALRNLAAPNLPPGRSSKENGADWVRAASILPEAEKVFRTPTHATCLTDDRNEKVGIEEDEDAYFTDRAEEYDGFSDARDAFSHAESFSMKCSMSAGTGVRNDSKSLTKDPHVKDFMIGRFLPDAQAMAVGSLQRTWRKPTRSPEAYSENFGNLTMKKRLPLDYQYKLSRAQLHAKVQEEEDVEEDDDDDGSYAGSGIFPSNACGLFHRLCLRNSLGLSNSGPGTKFQVKPVPVIHNRPSPHTEVLHHASFGQTKDEDSWEAVYWHKLSHGYYPHKGEERKLSESNQLTSWSDSQMFDGSSFINSTTSAKSLDKHEDPKGESGSWRRGSPDSCQKDYGCYWETTLSQERLKGAGSTSPANNRLHDKNLWYLQETPDCKSSENTSSDTKAIIEYSGNSSTGSFEFQLAEESIFSESSEGHIMQSRSPKIVESSISPFFERLNSIKVDGNDLDSIDDSDNSLALEGALLEKNDNSLTLSLVPPPLLTSPSESWLQRTFPSGPSNGPRLHQQSFLGIQLYPKKQISWASACDHKSLTYEKPSKMHPRRTRFAEVAKDA